MPADWKRGEPVLVSACLLGEPTLWDGSICPDDPLIQQLRDAGAEIISVCPEMLGGLPMPRPPAEPDSGDGRDVLAGKAQIRTVGEGEPEDVTEAFLAGARTVVEMALACGVRYAFLQERSPSCGVKQSHSGGGLVDGPGVTTAALEAVGIQVLPGGISSRE